MTNLDLKNKVLLAVILAFAMGYIFGLMMQ